MNSKTWSDNISESIQDSEMNRILEKISRGEVLSNIENNFLNSIGHFSEDYYKGFSYLSKNDVFDKIQSILQENRKVICNLCDRDGKIGIEIQSVNNNFDDEYCLKNGMKIELMDSYLYNVIYNIRKNEYSLESQEEFYEKIPIKNDY